MKAGCAGTYLQAKDSTPAKIDVNASFSAPAKRPTGPVGPNKLNMNIMVLRMMRMTLTVLSGMDE